MPKSFFEKESGTGGVR